MLKNIPAALSPDLLWCLASMGHGEKLVIVDRNFPAHDVVRHTSSGKLIELPGLDIPQAVQVILSVMPLDDFIPEPVSCMQVVGAPEKILPMQAEVHAIARASEGRAVGMERLERFAFYEAAKSGFAVVRTSEFRPYGCFLLTMGVIFDPRPDTGRHFPVWLSFTSARRCASSATHDLGLRRPPWFTATPMPRA
jgi:L-fucose mutarotase